MSRTSTRASTPHKGAYTAQWLEYRKRNTLFWLVFLGFMPGVLLIGIPLSRLLNVDNVAGLVAIIWMVAFVITGNYRAFWRCPRCRKPFFHKWWYHNFFARKCVHCKLPKYAGFEPPAA